MDAENVENPGAVAGQVDRVVRPVADARKPCTCDGAGRGPGRACVVQAGGRLGELWRCAKGHEPPDWLHLKQYGYAPGNYMSRCHRCDMTVAGLDKRAIICLPCAQLRHAERAELGERGVYRKAKAAYQPDDYQILCMNCQFIKRTEDKTANQHRGEWQQQHGDCSEAIE